jgi:putative restriction endonuclease
LTLSKYRRTPISPFDDPNIGCIILAEPFFFGESEWIPCPPAFARNIVVGKTFRDDTLDGAALWREVAKRLQHQEILKGPAMEQALEGPRFGALSTVMPRLGQGAFRILVTDAYNRRCAMTQERTLPVLEAAHIRRYSAGGTHELSNGLCLRTDLHKLFDKGYIAVDPDDRHIIVSRRIREEFENGRDYYQLHGRMIALPSEPLAAPSTEVYGFTPKPCFVEPSPCA